MKKLLVTGASGFLGWHLYKELHREYELTGIYYRQHFPASGLHWHRFNLLEEGEIKKHVAALNPDVILHAAAIANPNFCEEHPALSHHINVYSTVALAEAAAEQQIPMLFVSTDLVFNGSSGQYSEDDFAYPLSKYGEQKLAAEEALSNFERILVCRLPLLFGKGPEYAKNFFKDWLEKLKNGEEIQAFSDEYRTPLSGQQAALGLKKALNYLLHKGENSLFHLCGPDRCSRYELATIMAEVLGIEKPNILPLLRADLPMPAPRPEDVSMDGTLAKQILEFEPPSLITQLRMEVSPNVF